MRQTDEVVDERAPSIVEALAAVARDVPAVRKEDRNDHQKFMFRGVDAVVNAVGPALRRHGVLVLPELVSLERATVQTSRGQAMNSVTVRVRYTFHGPAGDELEALVPGEAFDSGDKATAKAMSVAFRTALLQALTLPTDEPDPDADSPAGTVPTGASQGGQEAHAPAALERALADHWNNADGLRRLHSWAAAQPGTPPEFLARVQARGAHLSTQGAPAPTTPETGETHP